MRRLRVYSSARVRAQLGQIVYGSIKDLLNNENITSFPFGGQRFYDADEIDELVRMLQL